MDIQETSTFDKANVLANLFNQNTDLFVDHSVGSVDSTLLLKHIDYDSAWKDIIEVYFQEFMACFYPELYNQIDWQYGYTFLDKELAPLTKAYTAGKRLVDKLIKVKSLHGKASWILIHIEIQQQRQKHFELRMFEYYSCLQAHYPYPIINLVILSDKHNGWRPHRYHQQVWNQDILQFNFFPVKLLDYQNKYSLDVLNPFSVVLEAHFAAMRTRHNIGERFDYKLCLTKSLYERGFKKADILILYRFIDWILPLPEHWASHYQHIIYNFEGEKKMRYITQGERLSLKKGFQQGMQQGEYLLLKQLLELRFQVIPQHYQERLEQADANTLLKWGKRILTANTLDELFQ